MSRRVILTDVAEGELESAYRWYAEHSPESAERWYNDFIDQLNSLANDPERFPLAPESGHFVAQVRQLLFGRRRKTHRALFTIRADTVVVVRIRHVAQAPLTELD
jgi:plasmid stabilization system protein ParE